MSTFHLVSLGCPKNFVDSEIIIGMLEKDNWKLIDHPDDADLLIVNTCGFIQPAVEEGVDEILELIQVKNENPGIRLVVTGCMVQRYRQKLEEELSEVDLFIGTEGVQEIASLIHRLFHGTLNEKTVTPAPFIMDSSMPRRLATPFFRAWMKITEGCDNRCSYCMIPSIRGPLRSRTIEDLVKEANNLEEYGVKELSLIAQDLTAYGKDFSQISQLRPLLRSLLKETTIPWIRLLYLYPSGITDEFLDYLASQPRIVPYLDIPFQHVSDSVLQRMNRRYSGDDLFRLVTTSRQKISDLSLRTTFLLGFPGETENDILTLEAFMKEAKLDHVGVFAYANEEGCPSEFFPNQISDKEKQDRLDHILSIQSAISAEIQKKYLGRIEPVIVEGVSKETDLLLEGRSRFQAPDIDGCIYINEGVANPGDIVQVRISETQVYDLVGGIVD